MPVVVDEEYRQQIEKARLLLRAIILAGDHAIPMLRLALDDAETYDPKAKIKGGPNGSIRNAREVKREITQGLDIAAEFCEQVLHQCPRITHADIYQLAGVVAVEVSGGPAIEFNPGREDSSEYAEDRLPNDGHDATQLRQIINRMGLRDEDFVALYGGLFAMVKYEIAGKPIRFDNSYFGILKNEKRTKLTPAERALVEDKKFSEIVNLYAGDKKKFFRDYAVAHKKVSELGFTPPPRSTSVPRKKTISAPDEPSSASLDLANGLTQGAIGLALATTVIILSFLLGRKNK